MTDSLEKRIGALEQEIPAIKKDIEWIKAILFAVLAVAMGNGMGTLYIIFVRGG